MGESLLPFDGKSWPGGTPQLLSVFADAFETRPTLQKLELYARMLDDLAPVEVRNALLELGKRRGGRFPTPHEIRQAAIHARPLRLLEPFKPEEAPMAFPEWYAIPENRERWDAARQLLREHADSNPDSLAAAMRGGVAKVETAGEEWFETGPPVDSADARERREPSERGAQ